MSNITVSFGKVNLATALHTLASFRVTPPFVRDSAANTGRVDVQGTQYAAATRHPEVGGGFTTKSVAHDEGTVILLQASRTRNRMRTADAGLFLRLRSSAPKIMVRTVLPTGPESVLGDRFISFIGNADILTLEELKALGFEIPRGWVSAYMQEDEIGELFLFEELAKQTAPRPTFVRIVTANGVEVRAIQPERARRLRIRRN